MISLVVIMNKDIVYDEKELSIAANQLLNYGEFLCKSIEEYVIILKELKSKGIIDDKICGNIEELIDKISLYKNDIYNISGNLKNLINKGVKEIINADNYVFIMDALDNIRITLSKFL